MANTEYNFKFYNDFPTEGVTFVDINPVLNKVNQRKQMAADLIDSVKHLKVDKVVAIDSRGFIFGDDIADGLDAGVVLARKKGKLPGKCKGISYVTEYSSTYLEIQLEAIKEGDRVLIHDDVLATGGTLAGVKELVNLLGGIVVAVSVIIEIEALNGRIHLPDCEVISICKL